ncbi:MAG: alginate export family protein [Bacteroidales bacterium]|nr:alginate export family protein [Bacteroidales bacterium]
MTQEPNIRLSGAILSLILLLSWQPAQAQFTLSGELRPRLEYREGYRRMPAENEKPAAFVYQRSRLNLEYSQDRITTHLSVQNVRAWGQDPQKVHLPSIDIHQAWFELQVNEKLFAKAGRQELKYDNQRFLSVNNWAQPAQKHDMLLLKYHHQSTRLHLGSAFNQSGDLINQNMSNFGTQYPVNNYKYMNFLWFHTPVQQKGKISLLAIAEGKENQNSGNLFIRGTWSVYSTWEFSRFNFMVNPGFQHGKTINGQDIEAYYFRSDISLQPLSAWKTTLGLEYFSGNDFSDPGDPKYRAFDSTHGSGHAHNGSLDYFTNFPSHTRGAGLVNPYFMNRFAINNETNFNIDFHVFALANKYMHNQQIIDKYLGTEVDLTLNYAFNGFTRIQMGYSMMFGTESMGIIRGGSPDRWAHWAFVMVTVQPVFFRSTSG